MRKQAARNVVLDRLHHGGVWICLGITAITGVMLAKRGYDFLTQDKPEIKHKQELLQKELLSEGSVDKILLKDSAKELNT